MQSRLPRNIAISILACSALSLATPVLAQRGGGGQGGAMSGGVQGQGDLDRLRDQDRLRDKVYDHDQDQDRLRDRDRLHIDQVVEGQLSTWSLLSDQEREQFQAQIRTAVTEQERNRIRSEHQAVVQQRARDLGIDAPFGPERAGAGSRDGFYLAQMLTEQERLRFHQQMHQASNEQERERIRTEMHTMARERARQMGVDMPAWFGQRRGQQ